MRGLLLTTALALSLSAPAVAQSYNQPGPGHWNVVGLDGTCAVQTNLEARGTARGVLSLSPHFKSDSLVIVMTTDPGLLKRPVGMATLVVGSMTARLRMEGEVADSGNEHVSGILSNAGTIIGALMLRDEATLILADGFQVSLNLRGSKAAFYGLVDCHRFMRGDGGQPIARPSTAPEAAPVVARKGTRT